ncbi:MAG: hypothetical protein ABI380_06960 [Edaphobacter sp.]
MPSVVLLFVVLTIPGFVVYDANELKELHEPILQYVAMAIWMLVLRGRVHFSSHFRHLMIERVADRNRWKA